ncbi:MAG: response regulator transcription factor [Clostridiales bacterium]|nr:response regulator transcription factor [Clostridiales bacterium]
MSISLLIADDHSLVREGLKQLIELEDDMVVVGQAADGVEALERIKKLKPDVVLLDINMPVMNGMETLKRIKTLNYKVKVIMLTIHNEVEYLVKTVDIGCDGYVLKDASSALLKEAIYAVYNGENFIQPALAPTLNSRLAAKSTSSEKLADLTRRELQVLKLVADGLFNKEIASRLKISERTVKNHISSIFKKIGVSDRTQAAVFAIKNDVVDI